MNALTVYRSLAVAVMLLFYALEGRSLAFILAFAAACLASSLYGFLQGACPCGVVELIWSGVAVRRWWALSSGDSYLVSLPHVYSSI